MSFIRGKGKRLLAFCLSSSSSLAVQAEPIFPLLSSSTTEMYRFSTSFTLVDKKRGSKKWKDSDKEQSSKKKKSTTSKSSTKSSSLDRLMKDDTMCLCPISGHLKDTQSKSMDGLCPICESNLGNFNLKMN